MLKNKDGRRAMLYYLIMLFCIVAHANSMCMEEEEQSTEVCVNFGALGLDLINYIAQFKDARCFKYRTKLGSCQENCALAWTIAPALLKFCYHSTPLETDLSNPLPGEKVLPNAQLWFTKDEGKFRLSEDIRRTNDVFYVSGAKEYDLLIYDGINKRDKAVFTLKYQPDTNNAKYDIYAVRQSKIKSSSQDYKGLQPLLSGIGTLKSLMLENERNRIMYSVKLNSGQCTLCIYNLPNLDENLYSFSYKLDSNLCFTKTVCLGKDTYFGITDVGKLYCLWLDDQNTIQLAEQKCSKELKDISVDNTNVTEKGFHQKIAFLTNKGDIYVTHLDAYAQPTLFYITTVKKPNNVKRLFYHDGKLLIVYQVKSKFFEWKDNFDLLYGCSLLRKEYQQCFETKDTEI
jgi:hypothetical protein